MHNDVLADELTRPADLGFEVSDAFQTVENNAIVTDRMNSFKRQYYRIDIIVGKILLKKMASLCSEEDTKMLQLKWLCKNYDRRVGLALIPFYLDRIDFIEEQIHNKQNQDPENSVKDIEFLKNMKKNIERDLDYERNQVRKDAEEIYNLWT